ncbi:MAG: hypothetical protein IMY67_11090 [Bacteroidetes bacterium]|nr:hypothetical protein [Bacteroidota bacterium]
MKSEKLELKHLAPYLPYGLKGRTKGGVWNDTEYLIHEYIGLNYGNNSINMKSTKGVSLWYNINKHKPILRLLSDLTKEIEMPFGKIIPMGWMFGKDWENHSDWDNEETLNKVVYNTYSCINGKVTPKHLPYFVSAQLLEMHFDVFGLIPKGLAIDINTITE